MKWCLIALILTSCSAPQLDVAWESQDGKMCLNETDMGKLQEALVKCHAAKKDSKQSFITSP